MTRAASLGVVRRHAVSGADIMPSEVHRMLEPGTQAPDFEVKDHTGKTRRLSDFRGKNVVLWFYPKADTPG